jgi:hypothetical protein
MEASRDKELRTLFDTSSGIDAWQVIDGAGMYGIASRVQPSGRDWSTFTVRKSRHSGAKTEWAKLREAISSSDGRVYPKWFVQAYTSKCGSRLISCAAVLTQQLVAYIEDHCCEQLNTRETGNAVFWVLEWDRRRFKSKPCVSEVCDRLTVVRLGVEDPANGR